MHVTKRNGSREPVNLSKIVGSIESVSTDLIDVDVFRVASKTVGGLVDGVSTRDLDMLSVRTAVGLIGEDPAYSKMAARILANIISKEVVGQNIQSFSQSIEAGFDSGLISDETLALVTKNRRKLDAAIKHDRDWLYEFQGMQTLYDRYLLKHPTRLIEGTSGVRQRTVIETPQYFLMRVACGLANNAREAIELYELLSSLEYMTSTPTLFNSGTRHSQMSSCYLLDSPLDDLTDIYKRVGDIASLSKFAGGIGLSLTRLRGQGALIKGTNGKANGLVPWCHMLSASVAAVNQGGKRKGAAAVYLEPHHTDVMAFLELKDQTGDKEARAYNLNLACWVSDLFMKRVKHDGTWSLFDPTVAPELTDLYGDAYEARYLELEAAGLYAEQLPARKLFHRMMRTLGETGNGWICFKDTCNKRGNQVGDGGIIHLSNLCTEILEVTSSGVRRMMGRDELLATSASNLALSNINIVGYDTARDSFEVIEGMEAAVCNLGSINLGRGYVKNGKLDKDKLHRNVALAVKYLDRVVDRNFYPIPESAVSNDRWRPVGLGAMGLADLFFQLRLPYESPEAIRMSAVVAEEIYFQALTTSNELAKLHGPHRDFHLTKAAKGQLQFDLAGVTPSDPARWDVLRQSIMTHGLRNSLLIAIAPTATISHICGVEECVEPIKTNLLKRETLSGEFIWTNKYLIDDLKKLGRWNEETNKIITRDNGSIRNVLGLPDELHLLYKTVWDMSMKSVIAHATARGPYIDQSQSLNLFVDLNKHDDKKRIGVMSSIYMHAWEAGTKTTYYFRSLGATTIEKTTLRSTGPEMVAPAEPEVCESCT